MDAAVSCFHLKSAPSTDRGLKTRLQLGAQHGQLLLRGGLCARRVLARLRPDRGLQVSQLPLDGARGLLGRGGTLLRRRVRLLRGIASEVVLGPMTTRRPQVAFSLWALALMPVTQVFGRLQAVAFASRCPAVPLVC